MKTVCYTSGKCRSETATPNAGQDGKRQRIATALIVFFTVCCWAGTAVAQRPTADDRQTPASENAPDRGFAHIYFANKAGTFLKAEERALPQAHTPEAFAENIVRALIGGPKKALMRTVPPSAGIRAIYILSSGTACVDMTREITDAHPGGVMMERLCTYAIVNSLILNVPEIRAVKLLIDGREALTLAGHMDLRNPFRAEMLLVR